MHCSWEMNFLDDDRFLLLPMDLHSTHYQGYIKVKVHYDSDDV